MLYHMFILLVKCIAGAQLLEFGFNQVDFSGDEGILTVTVTISGDNNGNFSINVTPLTFTQFENNAGILPEELEAIDLPDPAELSENCMPLVTKTLLQKPTNNYIIMLVATPYAENYIGVHITQT